MRGVDWCRGDRMVRGAEIVAVASVMNGRERGRGVLAVFEITAMHAARGGRRALRSDTRTILIRVEKHGDSRTSR